MKKILLLILIVLLQVGCKSNDKLEEKINLQELKSIDNKKVEVKKIKEQKEDYSIKNLEDNYYVCDYVSEDVTGDGIKDNIYLIGYQEESYASCLYTNIYLLINDGYTGSYNKIIPKQQEGVTFPLEIQDFNSDNVKDIFIGVCPMGCGGALRSFFEIISVKDNDAITIFDDEDICEEIDFDLTLKDDYILEIEIKETDKIISFQLEESICDWLEEESVYADGKIVEQVVMTVDSFSDLKVIDINNDGVFKLIGSRYLALMSHTAGLGFINITIEYNSVECKWEVVNLEFKEF